MSTTVTLLAGSDHRGYAGLPLLLVRGETTVAKATTNDQGVATFDYTPAAGESLRIRADLAQHQGESK